LLIQIAPGIFKILDAAARAPIRQAACADPAGSVRRLA
jgi:hypothetical protein